MIRLKRVKLRTDRSRHDGTGAGSGTGAVLEARRHRAGRAVRHAVHIPAVVLLVPKRPRRRLEDAAARQEKIRALMEEDDRAWRAERKKKLMGKYAGVESWEEVETMLGEDREKEAKGECAMRLSFAIARGCVVLRSGDGGRVVRC